MASSAAHALQRQFKELSKNPIPGFQVTLKDESIFEWEVGIIGHPQTIYEGGYFLVACGFILDEGATLSFPQDYPFNPPTFTFRNEFFHPNVYKNGKLCISILHPPGDDPMSGEKAEERWNPTQSVESILLSIVSLLSDPNCSSPANVDAGKMYREDRPGYVAKVKEQVQLSKNDIPDDLVMPKTAADFLVKPPQEIEEDENFWYEEQDEDDDDEDEDMDDGEDEEDEDMDEEEEEEEEAED
ncbi:ubiquitin-conjugating enzyme/RWD-like protein [Blyttiomyces helicus]|uniref:Ubiquitin-conjugating enzyme/RWD-like protein n=1 Tax=Blyttiomyces helicus TaxID=388810 RepID=A0A4P9WLA0_9FUNG|nr:ubiquitin-conjugating enzyme/RWD-like protein [Blyttiomyces helicus]|eukprot:RKO93172.1 ubiquitin-conjugating enzyme/RWD-like protein [Blyttiomyces helicus]